MAKKPRRKCANQICRAWFNPARDGQVVCSYECATAVAKAQTAKNRAEALRAEKKRQREKERAQRARQAERRQAVKPLSYFRDQAQLAFNEFIRYGIAISHASVVGDITTVSITLGITVRLVLIQSCASTRTTAIASAPHAITIFLATLPPTVRR